MDRSDISVVAVELSGHRPGKAMVLRGDSLQSSKLPPMQPHPMKPIPMDGHWENSASNGVPRAPPTHIHSPHPQRKDSHRAHFRSQRPTSPPSGSEYSGASREGEQGPRSPGGLSNSDKSKAGSTEQRSNTPALYDLPQGRSTGAVAVRLLLLTRVRRLRQGDLELQGSLVDGVSRESRTGFGRPSIMTALLLRMQHHFPIHEPPLPPNLSINFELALQNIVQGVDMTCFAFGFWGIFQAGRYWDDDINSIPDLKKATFPYYGGYGLIAVIPRSKVFSPDRTNRTEMRRFSPQHSTNHGPRKPEQPSLEDEIKLEFASSSTKRAFRLISALF
ncbi:predicted protein [Uncinocarpus reesii 1704]|uniref:Uncharacterized protein n=1 Tax=Uncinocarpus reesii (strain UAMH 1704) TaxID=336963 RepID=C4JP93_UNCRE|nr:uncharacterized protein UREG_04475 [Uncinocarpus reesii 1704]EEP79629.1 predicted protein [Uncinocarpus reesii 1704]